MNNKKTIGFGFRGSLMILYQFLAFCMFGGVNSFGQNIQANVNAQTFGWDASLVATSYTIVIVAVVILQFFLGNKIANARNVKRISILVLIIAVIGNLGMATVTGSQALWIFFWCVAVGLSNFGATLVVGVLVGQWFPRRKGTVMGIATLAFPVMNSVGMILFQNLFFSKGTVIAWIPFLILDVVAIIICAVFLKDYPEQCGAFPDNDKSMTFEQQKAMMEAEAQAKRNSVWKPAKIVKLPDFWFMSIAQGLIQMAAVGAMTQIIAVFSTYESFYAQYGSIVLLAFSGIACLGSYLIGIFDTKKGTRAAVALASIFMLCSGFICCIPNLLALLIGFACLQVFMGAGSNFAVSAAAQYWRREDFPSAFSMMNPVLNLIAAFGPIIFGVIGLKIGFSVAFLVVGICGVIALVFMILFKPSRITALDAKLRKEAGISETGISKSAEEMLHHS